MRPGPRGPGRFPSDAEAIGLAVVLGFLFVGLWAVTSYGPLADAAAELQAATQPMGPLSFWALFVALAAVISMALVVLDGVSEA